MLFPNLTLSPHPSSLVGNFEILLILTLALLRTMLPLLQLALIASSLAAPPSSAASARINRIILGRAAKFCRPQQSPNTRHRQFIVQMPRVVVKIFQEHHRRFVQEGRQEKPGESFPKQLMLVKLTVFEVDVTSYIIFVFLCFIFAFLFAFSFLHFCVHSFCGTFFFIR
jgi:hypothetical protein